MSHNTPLSAQDLDQLFRSARTHRHWLDREVPDSLLQQAYDLAKWGPTSANCCPMRVVFVRSKEAKEKLKPGLDEGNLRQTMEAPVTAIFANDLKFYEHMPFLFPHAPDAASWFAGNDAKIAETAMRNGTLQAAYFMLALRSLGLDCGPMSGFDPAKLKAAFFSDAEVQVNFICNIGYGDIDQVYPRGPRFDFDTVCRVA